MKIEEILKSHRVKAVNSANTHNETLFKGFDEQAKLAIVEELEKLKLTFFNGHRTVHSTRNYNQAIDTCIKWVEGEN